VLATLSITKHLRQSTLKEERFILAQIFGTQPVEIVGAIAYCFICDKSANHGMECVRKLLTS
jgi:hypothetical protein